MTRVHPVYGYDLDAVSKVLCFYCSQPIGNEEYREITTLARFGQMMFIHKRCDPESEVTSHAAALETTVRK